MEKNDENERTLPAQIVQCGCQVRQTSSEERRTTDHRSPSTRRDRWTPWIHVPNCCSLMLLLCVAATIPGASGDLKRRHPQENFTNLLNTLLDGYEKKMRPGAKDLNHGPATKIMVDMNIRSMGPISEKDMTYSMDTYFRQTWMDGRLAFGDPDKRLSVHIKILERIWKPDTFFYNGHGSYLHTITTPNKLLRIMGNGTILYSMRLTIKANCPMYLQYFPMDQQSCPLQFGSYAYTKEQLYYTWKHGTDQSIKTADDMRLSQYDLKGHPAYNITEHRNGGQYSTLKVTFRLVRHMGYFLIQVYVPCTLIVVLSWVSFWLNREATADRVGLGITTVLTLTTLSMDTRDDLPKVAYATALDWFVITCFGFVIASLLEYAAVHYFTKIGSGEIDHDTDSEDEDTEQEADPHGSPGKPTAGMNRIHRGNNSYVVHSHHNNCHFSPMHTTTTATSSTTTTTTTRGAAHRTPRDSRTDGCLTKFCNCLQGSHYYRRLMRRHSQRSGVNSVSMIDKVSRILFPLAFITLNIIYWIGYTRYL